MIKMKQNQTGQSEPPVFNRIYITYGKDAGYTENDFQENFEQFGSIKQVHISKEKSSNQPKGLAYIRFTNTSEACLAVEEMNGAQMCGHPRRLKVHIAHEKNDNLEIDVEKDIMLQRIFIRHSKSHTEEELRSHFGQFGNIIWLYMLKDKETKESRGSSFVKFEKQSEAAMAIEQCDKNYKARWADVRLKDGTQTSMGGGGGLMDNSSFGFSRQQAMSSSMGGMGLLGMGGGAMGGGAMGGGAMGNQGMRGGLMGAGSRGGLMSGNTSLAGGPMDFLSGKQIPGNSNRMEALVPSDLSQEQVYRLFDIAPGLQSCIIDQSTGLAKLEYATPQCAAHAREKIDGLDIYGYTIAVRIAKAKPAGLENTAFQLQETLSHLQGSGVNTGPQLNTLVHSIQQVTHALQQHGMSGDAMGGGNVEMVPWCNVPLPGRKSLAPNGTPERAKLYILSKPTTVSNEVLRNAFCRFGNLIHCGYVPGKNFGFVIYGSNESAQTALNTLHGNSLMDNQFRVEFSTSEGKDKESNGEAPNKRPRQW